MQILFIVEKNNEVSERNKSEVPIGTNESVHHLHNQKLNFMLIRYCNHGYNLSQCDRFSLF